MPEAHIFSTEATPWTGNDLAADARIKVFESRQTHPNASVILVELKVGGVVGTHHHEKEIETVYVLAGQGLLTHGEAQSALTAGMGASIPVGLPHGLRNTGDVPVTLIAIHTPPTR